VLQPGVLKEQVWSEVNAKNAAEDKAREEAKRNPTPARGAKTSALSGAVDAVSDFFIPSAQAATPGQQQPPKQTGGDPNTPLQEFGAIATDVAHSVDRFFSSNEKSQQGFKDSMGDIITGPMQIAGQAPEGQAWKDEKARREELSKDPDYYQGSLTADVFKPAHYLGAGANSLAKMFGVGGVQALVEPAEGPMDRFTNTMRGGAFNAAFGAASKVLPSTVVGPSVRGEGERLLEEFPAFSKASHSAQTDPNTLEGIAARVSGVREAAAGRQNAAITKDIMEHSGIPGKEISQANITQAYKNLDAERSALFGVGKFGKHPEARVYTTAGKDFKGLVRNNPEIEDAMGKSPALMQLHGALTSAKGGNVQVRDLFQAWQDVGTSGMARHQQEQVRNLIQSVVGKHFGQEGFEKFMSIAEKTRNLREVEKAWAGSTGGGTMGSAGHLTMDAIKNTAKKGTQYSVLEDAAALINKFGVKNPGAENVNILDLVKSGSSKVIGNALHWAEQAVPRPDSKIGKHVVEGLRALSTNVAPRELNEERHNAP
jgi:hypothetical protein